MGLMCAECQGEVNVPMHNGATLRCGCGKTVASQGAPATTPAAAARHRSELADLLTLMREHKALRVKQGDLEVELSPGAFAPQWPAQSSSLGNVEDKQCRCGHSVEVEHNDAGQCLQGCEPDACAPASGAQ